MNKSDCCNAELALKNCWELNGHPIYYCCKCGKEYTTKESRKLIAHKPIRFQKPIKPKVTKYYQVKWGKCRRVDSHSVMTVDMVDLIVANSPAHAIETIKQSEGYEGWTDIKLIEIVEKDTCD